MTDLFVVLLCLFKKIPEQYVRQIRPQPFWPTSFPIHSPLIILPYDALLSPLLTE
jgi:hypothetical protein